MPPQRIPPGVSTGKQPYSGFPSGALRLAARADQVVRVASGTNGHRRRPLSQGRLASLAPACRAQPAALAGLEVRRRRPQAQDSKRCPQVKVAESRVSRSEVEARSRSKRRKLLQRGHINRGQHSKYVWRALALSQRRCAGDARSQLRRCIVRGRPAAGLCIAREACHRPAAGTSKRAGTCRTLFHAGVREACHRERLIGGGACCWSCTPPWQRASLGQAWGGPRAPRRTTQWTKKMRRTRAPPSCPCGGPCEGVRQGSTSRTGRGRRGRPHPGRQSQTRAGVSRSAS